MLTASPEQQRLLLDVQDCDNKIARIRRDIAALNVEQRTAELREQLTALSPVLIETSGSRDDVSAEIARIEDDVRLVDQRLAQDNQWVSASSSPKDVAGLEHEIQTLLARKSALEDAELDAMQRLEDLNSQLQNVELQRAQLQTACAEVESAVAAERGVFEDELAAVEEARSMLVSTIDLELYDLYEKQRQRYGVGAGLLRQGVSGGSGMALSAHDIESIRAAAPDAVILCPESNCILVRTDESGL